MVVRLIDQANDDLETKEMIRLVYQSTQRTQAIRLGFSRRTFNILALESSADDTCASVVDDSRRILSNVVWKQHEIHQAYKGIHPMYAQHAHVRAMPGVIKQALKEANLRVHDIDAYAFTQGPGMFNCLSVSCSSASAMAALVNKPLIGVNHMQGHALTPFMTEANPPEFPFLTCLMSGGHTQLVLATSFDEFEILVDTGSLAVGQCFDRLGAALNLPAPQGYGPALESLALSLPSSDPEIPHFAPLPLPPLSSPLFEFSGILLSLLEVLHKISPGSDPNAKHSVDPTGIKQAIQVGAAREFQRSVGEAFVRRIQRCLAKLKEDRGTVIKGLVASGGVASNKYLKQRFQSLEKSCGLRVMFPPISLCTDNAAMIANAAIHRYKAQSFTDLSDTLPRRKWSIEELSRPAGLSGDPAVQIEIENGGVGGS